MSHVAKVNCIIKDLDALQASAESLGGELLRGETRFRFYAGATEPCVHALQLTADKGGHQVGLRKRTDEAGRILEDEYDLHYDKSFASHVNRAFGQDLAGLRKEYAAQVAERQLRRAGHRVTRGGTTVAGEIRLVAYA